MPSRREQIRMTPDEVAAFLRRSHTMTVATLHADGRPHLVAMWYGFLGDDVALWTYARSQKVVNLRRDPRISCLVGAGESYDELRGVQLGGTAEIIDDPRTVVDVGASVFRRYEGGEVTEEVRAGLAEMGRGRVAIRVHVEDVASWDHRKLGATSTTNAAAFVRRRTGSRRPGGGRRALR